MHQPLLLFTFVFLFTYFILHLLRFILLYLPIRSLSTYYSTFSPPLPHPHLLSLSSISLSLFFLPNYSLSPYSNFFSILSYLMCHIYFLCPLLCLCFIFLFFSLPTHPCTFATTFPLFLQCFPSFVVFGLHICISRSTLLLISPKSSFHISHFTFTTTFPFFLLPFGVLSNLQICIPLLMLSFAVLFLSNEARGRGITNVLSHQLDGLTLSPSAEPPPIN